MVRGMGMGMKVLDLLVNEAEKQGADKEAFAFLTRPRFKGNLEKIGKAIAECDWRIPASEMRALARKRESEEYGLDSEAEIEQAANLWWSGTCIDFGIPYDRYCQNPNHGDPAILPIFLKELDGKAMEYPLILSPFIGSERRFVVVDFITTEALYRPGDRIDINQIDALAVADCKYFDFEK